MQTRVAVMAIIVEKGGAVERLNAVLHEYGEHIIGRMGIPYRKKGINIVSIALDAPQDTISALAGKLGNIEGLSVKTAYSNVVQERLPVLRHTPRQRRMLALCADAGADNGLLRGRLRARLPHVCYAGRRKR